MSRKLDLTNLADLIELGAITGHTAGQIADTLIRMDYIELHRENKHLKRFIHALRNP